MSERDVVCRVADGELDADVVLRTATTIAFLDHKPLFPGHVLVCPLPHAADLVDLPAAAVAGLFSDVRRVAAALPDALGCEGTFVAINNRVSQSVPHLHVHVVPRSKGDGLRGFFWPRRSYATGERAAVAQLIREALDQVPPLG